MVWKQSAAVFFILLTRVLVIRPYTGSYPDIQVCYSDVIDIGGAPENGSYGVLKAIFGRKCTHVFGNLVIHDIHRIENGKDPDLSFLQTIREITGYLIIMHSNVARVPLTNLRVIRADNQGYRARPDLEPASIVIRNNYKGRFALKQIDLSNLRAIVRGNVYIYDNPGLCEWHERINWTELFETPGEQEVLGKALVEKDLIHPPGYQQNFSFPIHCKNYSCSKKCSGKINFERASCWGPESEHCQESSKCNDVHCNRCYKADEDTRACCHARCLGGCWGPLPDQCVACKEYNDSGTCVTDCPSPHLMKNGIMIDNPLFKYRLGTLCVSECPAGFLIENDACVTHCSTKNSHAVGNICQPCFGQCPKVCELTYPTSLNGATLERLDGGLLRQLEGCTYLKGNLIISNDSFYPMKSSESSEAIQQVDELWNLHSLTEVSGYIYLDLKFFGNRLKNFSFLENLVKVSGYHSSVKASVIIMNSEAELPGLRSLRYVLHGYVIFYNNRKLCFVESLPWISASNERPKRADSNHSKYNGDMLIIFEPGSNKAMCEQKGSICHEECDAVYGCWGPSNDQCVRCRHWRAGPYTCVAHCDDQPGFVERYQTNVSSGGTVDGLNYLMSGPDADNICRPCHEECKRNCIGPGADECVGGCRNVRSNGKCMTNCHLDQYLDVHLRTCEPCHPQCHSRITTHLPVCSGPGRFPGDGGCNKCEKLLLLDNPTTHSSPINHTIICLRGDCPSGTYADAKVSNSNQSTLAKYAETFTGILPICQPCHRLCTECSGMGVFEANQYRLGCIKCSGYWFRDECVEICPATNSYYTEKALTYNHSHINGSDLSELSRVYSNNGRCLACDRNCHDGCWGPEPMQCQRCRTVRIHLTLLPKAMVHNKTFLRVQMQLVERQNLQLVEQFPRHHLLGSFTCAPSCPDGWGYLVNDPSTGDRLCYYKPTLSTEDRGKLLKDNQFLLDTGVISAGLEQQETADVTLRNIAISLCVVIIIIALLCSIWSFTICLLKKNKGGKNAKLRYLLSCLLNKKITGFDYMRASGSEPGYYEMSTIPKHTNEYNSGDENLDESSGARAPNLGRLIMIQSDQLTMDENAGPLGTGAFGSVYRGIWKCTQSTARQLGYDEQSWNNVRPGSTQSASTMLSTLSESVEDADASTLLLQQSNRNGAAFQFISVAVKVLNDTREPSDLNDLLDEAKVMASVSHRHCLPLLGVCISQSRKCLVTAYVVNGSLERYLRVNISNIPGSLLLEWCAQIADGMAYLQSRGIIHRDLATRNVLVTSRDRLQITDFGLAKMLDNDGGEVILTSGRVPIRWLAPETLIAGRYSSKTDVWAYGITVWEIFTFGRKPYEHVETVNVKSHVLAGNRLHQPNVCTKEMYQVMLNCWLEDPLSRPTFEELYKCFRAFIFHPDRYVHARPYSSVSMTEEELMLTPEMRSRLSIYPGSHQSNDLSHRTQSTISNASSSHVLVRRPNVKSRFYGWNLATGGRFVQQRHVKRPSIPSQSENNTLSTSLSIMSSGLSEQWNPNSHHSHPALIQDEEPDAETAQAPIFTDPNIHHLYSRPFNWSGVNTNSWASSGQPLLIPEHDSSLSQMVMTNLGYTSSDSRISMGPPGPASDNTADIQTTTEQINAECVLPSHIGRMNSTMPANFCLEAAAGYVWPQWPSNSSECIDSLGSAHELHNEDDLCSLERQLWQTRRSRQRRYYLWQSRHNRPAMRGLNFVEEVIEEGAPDDLSQIEDRYSVDPTSEGTSDTHVHS